MTMTNSLTTTLLALFLLFGTAAARGISILTPMEDIEFYQIGIWISIILFSVFVAAAAAVGKISTTDGLLIGGEE